MQIKHIKLVMTLFLFLNLTACSTLDKSLHESKRSMGIFFNDVSNAAQGFGKKIGNFLNPQDRKNMARTTRQAAVTGKSGSWSNPKNKTKGKARVIATKTKKSVVKVPVLRSKVKQVPPLDMMSKSYITSRVSNVRGGPSTKYVIVGSLKNKEVVTVVGKVKSQNWYLISQGGIGSGFVHTSLLKPTSNTPNSKAPQGDVTVKQVSTSQVCRTIEQSVTLADGSTKSETIEACKGANGWKAK